MESTANDYFLGIWFNILLMLGDFPQWMFQ